MIKNQRQYQQALKQAVEFRSAVARIDAEVCPVGIDPVMHKAMYDGVKSKLISLEDNIAEFEELTAGNVGVIKLSGLDMLPIGLIKARIARGMSQKDLANLLGVKHQQVQRWEHEDYENVGFSRLKEIASALKLEINEEIILSTGGVEDRNDSGAKADRMRSHNTLEYLIRPVKRSNLSMSDCIIAPFTSWISGTSEMKPSFVAVTPWFYQFR